MKFTTKLLSGAALAVALINSASASTIDVGSISTASTSYSTSFSSNNFTDTFTFSITSAMNLTVSAPSTSTLVGYGPQFGPNGMFISQGYLVGTAISSFALFSGNTKIGGDNNKATVFSDLAAGDYSIQVSGAGYQRANYTLNLTTTLSQKAAATAVPEPEAYAMMLAGLGLIGFAARRKQAV